MAENRIQFSVILPVYNAEATLVRTLKSLGSQNQINFQLCAVDDGSNDHSFRLLQKYRNSSNFEVLLKQQENAGVAAARNAAVRMATTPWLLFLDADDEWSPLKTETLARAIQKRPEIDLWTHGMSRQSQARIFNVVPAEDFSWKKILIEGNPLITSSVAVKKKRFQAIHGMEEDRSISSAEDWDCWIRLLKAGATAGVINQTLGTYYDHDLGLSKDLENHHSACFNVIEKFWKQQLLTDDEWKQAIRQKSYELARQAHKLRDFEKAVTWYQDSVPSMKRRFLELMARICISL